MTDQYSPDDGMRSLLSLPVKIGGMAIRAPDDLVPAFGQSKLLSSPLDHFDVTTATLHQERIKTDIQRQKQTQNKQKSEEILAKDRRSQKFSTTSQ